MDSLLETSHTFLDHPWRPAPEDAPLLRLRPPIKDWTAFDPGAYLNEYYADLGEENLAILRFYVDVFRSLTPKSVMLDFGSGPTIYSLISAVSKVAEIHIVEYLEANRVELRKWFQGDPTAFNWQHFIKAALEMEKKRTLFGVRRPAPYGTDAESRNLNRTL